MATISSPGVGSGLDIKNIVSQMLALEQRPLTQLQTAATSTRAQLSAFGQLKSQLANLQDQATRLATPGVWSALSASSSSSSAVTASVTTGALPGSFSVQVSQLASAQSVASSVIAADAELGGKLTIALGQWADVDLDPGTVDNPVFTPKADTTAIEVDIEPGDTLEDVARKINQANAGVSATILRDTSGERLLVRASQTGEANGFRITAGALTPGSALDALVYDPENALTGAALTQLGQDTLASVNGVQVRSSNNRFEGVVAGVNLTVNQVTTGSPVDVTIKSDTAGMRTAIKNFVESYNALNNALAEMTKYDAATKTAGTLQGDSTAVGLQNALRRMLGGNSGAPGELKSLSALGISFGAGGTLSIDDTKLNNALAQPEAVKSFFVGDTDAPGLASRVRDFTRGMLSVGGAVASRNESLQASIDRNTKAQERLKDRLTLVEERLYKQYSTLDANLSSLNALSNYVNQQVTAWNNQKK